MNLRAIHKALVLFLCLVSMLMPAKMGLGQGNNGSITFDNPIGWKYPEGIYCHTNGLVYVGTEYGIHVYTQKGRYIFSFATDGTVDGSLHTHGIDELSNGNLVIGDMGSNRVQIYTPEGRLVSTFGEGEFQYVPQGVAVSSTDDIFVVDHIGRVVVFNSSGDKKYEFPVAFASTSCSIDPSGFVWVVDRANSGVARYYQDGSSAGAHEVGRLGLGGDIDGLSISNSGILAVLQDGLRQWFVDAGDKKAWIWDLNGWWGPENLRFIRHQTIWGDGLPRGSAFDAQNNLYIGISEYAQGNSKIVRYFYPSPPASTITIDPNGQWATRSITATIETKDNSGSSGIKDIRYQVNNGIEVIAVGTATSFILSDDGIYTVSYWHTTNEGYVETPNLRTVRIDKTRPSVDAFVVGAMFTMSSSDNLSGIVANRVIVDGGLESPYNGPLTLPPGAHTVTYWATDLAGNESTREVVLVGVSVASVAVSPTNLFSTKAGVGTVKLSLASPAGGVVVMLESNSPAVSVPVSVTVPAGALSVTFPVTAGTVATDTKAVISASVGGQEVHGTVYILVPFPKTLTVSPSTIIGGDAGVGTVALASNAGVGGQVVNLSSSNSNVVVPATVTVPAGATSATFPIQTRIVGNDIAVAISAEADGAGISSTLLVRRVAPKSITFAPSSVVGGNSSVATLTVTKPAPAGGIVIDLRSVSSNVSVPATVTIAAGATTATFPVTTVPVKKSESAMIQAYAAGVKVSAVITVTATSVVSVSLNPTTVVGGLNSTATVTLNGVAPVGGTTIQLFSTNVAASVPTSVVVPGGSKTVTFPVTTVAVAANTTASIATKYLGTIKSAVLTIAAPTISTLTLSPSSLTGGGTSKLTIKLSGKAATGGVVVTLTSSNTVVAQLPTSVTIPAGADTVDVNIQTGAVAVTTNVTITAKTGAVAKTAVLTVNK